MKKLTKHLQLSLKKKIAAGDAVASIVPASDFHIDVMSFRVFKRENAISFVEEVSETETIVDVSGRL